MSDNNTNGIQTSKDSVADENIDNEIQTKLSATQEETAAEKPGIKSKEEKVTDEKITTESSSEEIQQKTEDVKVDTNKNEANLEVNTEISPVLLDKIRKQVEFYFGNVNMQRDKFLIEQTKLDDGWVPMSVMLNFKILASLSKDVEVILKALENSDMIEISNDRKKIRRSPNKPLPTYDEGYRKEQESRTLYLKGFPLDTTMETLKSHFEDNKDIECINMRKYKKDKEYHFKGSIFLQFKSLEAAKSFIGQESVKFKDTELIKMWSADYQAFKEKEREERLKKKEENMKAVQNKKSAKGNQKNDGQNKINFPKGSVIHFTDIQKDIPREDLKEKLSRFGVEIAYIDYNMGDKEGWIRLQGENSAKELIEKLDENKLKIKESNIIFEVIEGEAEEAYFVKIQESMAAHRMNRYSKGRNSKKSFKRRRSPTRDDNGKKIRLEN